MPELRLKHLKQLINKHPYLFQITGASCIVLVCAASYSCFWFLIAHQTLQILRGATNPEKLPYFRIYSGESSISGYPFKILLSINNVSVESLGETHVFWNTNKVEIKTSPWKPNHLSLRIPVSSAGHSASTPSNNLQGAIKLVKIDINFDRSWQINAVSMEVNHPTVTNASGATALKADALSTGWTRSNNNRKSDNWHILASVTNLQTLTWPLKAIEEVTLQKLEATVSPEFVHGPIEDSLRKWRDAGGTINIHKMMLTWGRLGIYLDGTLSVDEQYRPLGAFRATTQSFIPLIKQLEEAGLINLKQAAIAKVAIIAAAKKTDSDNLHIPITAQSGYLFVGPLPITRLPSLSTRKDRANPAPDF